MSIFGRIAEAIFGSPAHAETAPPPAAGSVPAPGAPPVVASASPVPSAQAASASAAAPKLAPVDVAAVLDKLDEDSDEDLDWRKSIVDLMKLLELDSSLSARRELADELGFTGDKKDSATMNVWLHKQVMAKLAANGGIVPADLKD